MLKLSTVGKITFIRVCLVPCYAFFSATIEMSHRTSDFSKILNTAENLLRELL